MFEKDGKKYRAKVLKWRKGKTSYWCESKVLGYRVDFQITGLIAYYEGSKIGEAKIIKEVKGLCQAYFEVKIFEELFEEVEVDIAEAYEEDSKARGGW